MAVTQRFRRLAVSTALGKDKLLIQSLSLNESLGRLFQMEVELRGEDRDIKFEDIVGTAATVRLELPGGKGKRYFNGYVSRFAQVEHQGSYAVYGATLVPWMWFLTRTADCRIFQKQRVPDIIEAVFKEHGFTDYKLKLTRTYREWEFCVQYRETDFNFVSRLMEHEGIYYYFEHADKAHTLVLADSLSAHDAYDGYETMIYRPPTSQQEENAETITDWSVEQQVQPGQYALNDFNFTTPKASLLANANISRECSQADYEVYDYPGEYEKRVQGEAYAKVRIQELQSQYEILRAETTVRGVAAGCTFTMKGNPRSDQNREYLITGVSMQIKAGGFESGQARAGLFYECRFTAVPVDAKCPFRPQRITPKPLIQGPQTAIVVGPMGNEIHTEDHARVKVQFHWDRYGKFDENSSCWIRVSQPWAGKGWGSMSTPRIGQEVIVEFLEGDPDRPIITGSVYNADQKPPYAGGRGVVSGLKSQTHKGQGFNEISMDDTAGKEKMTVNAQYDHNTSVGNNQSNTIGNNRTTSVSVDDSETIGSNQKIKVGSNQETTVGSNQKLTVGADQTNSIGSNQETSVGASQKNTVGAAQTESIGSSRTTSVAAADKLTVGGPQPLSVSGPVSITSGASIELSVGGSSIKISPGGIDIASGGPIKITGAIVKVNS